MPLIFLAMAIKHYTARPLDHTLIHHIAQLDRRRCTRPVLHTTECLGYQPDRLPAQRSPARLPHRITHPSNRIARNRIYIYGQYVAGLSVGCIGVRPIID